MKYLKRAIALPFIVVIMIVTLTAIAIYSAGLVVLLSIDAFAEWCFRQVKG